MPGNKICNGPRLVLNSRGDILCTYMEQTKLGMNNFVPMLSVSHDGARTWIKRGPLFPDLIGKESIFGSISADVNRRLYFFGSIYKMDTPEEPFWKQETYALKSNELFWSTSQDDGNTWSAPRFIPMPVRGSSEAPCAMCITRQGKMFICYSPYNTFHDTNVDTSKIIVMNSEDRGESWKYDILFQFEDEGCCGAEAWVTELNDGTMIGAAYQQKIDDSVDYENLLCYSTDGGISWSQTIYSGFKGESISLCPTSSNRCLLVYNQRKNGEIGVWAAEAAFTNQGVKLLSNEPIYKAETGTTVINNKAGSRDWTDFSFGEPSAMCLSDNRFLFVLWCDQTAFTGIWSVVTQKNQIPAQQISV
jgi:hypothetical protein